MVGGRERRPVDRFGENEGRFGARKNGLELGIVLGEGNVASVFRIRLHELRDEALEHCPFGFGVQHVPGRQLVGDVAGGDARISVPRLSRLRYHGTGEDH